MTSKKKKRPVPSPEAAATSGSTRPAFRRYWPYVASVCGITLLLFLPAIGNGFTNWDDILYVTGNELLKHLDADGLRAIWSTPVVSNFHPLTVFSLALNYQAGGLEPMTYHLTDVCLHTLNTGLVFFLILMLSGRQVWVSVFVALLFGIHPMHVESVAWVSERKDLLYTFFYLLAMISYVRYVRQGGMLYLIGATLLGGLSLLSKPAAIVLPLSLLAIDYLFRRKWSARLLLEKLPLIIAAGAVAWLTMSIQSERAVASLALHSIPERISFAGFGVIWYVLKSIVPWPLSALHPFPEKLNLLYYLAPIASLAIIAGVAWRVKNRYVIFGLAFFLINLLLVLQLVSIGNAVVAERYTYVPYIGLFFALGMACEAWFRQLSVARLRVILGLTCIWLAVLMMLTVIRIRVWENSQTLWTDVLQHYPDSKRAWTNKGLDFYAQKNWPEVIGHLTRALEADPDFADALEWRARAYMENQEPGKALEDATRFHMLYGHKEAAKFLYARALDQNGKSNEALQAYTSLVQAFPQNWVYWNSRGTLQFNKFRLYPEARADFERAIQLNPESGSAYLNLSRCHYMMSDLAAAQQMAATAARLGHPPDAGYAQLLGM